MLSLSDKKQADIIETLHSTSRYLYGIVVKIEYSYFEQW